MRASSLHLIATLSALTVVGCMAEATSSDPPSGDVTFTDHVHQMPVRDRDSHDGTLQAGSITPNSAPAGAHLSYNGGKVIQNVAITKVLYGSGTYIPELTSTTGVNMASSYTQMATSGVFDWLNEYNTTSPAQSIGRGSYQGSVQITPASSRNGSTISDANIQAEIAAQISAGTLPAPTDNQIYMVNFPSGKTITQGGSSSCVSGGFCAYHGTFKIGTQNVYYGVLPSLTGGCATGCGSAPTTFQNQQSVASHELIEAVTDAEVGLATVVGPPLAWYDATNGEIGDICNAQQGTFVGTDGATYTIQKEFSNQQNDCITTRTVSTTPDFSIALSPTSATLAQGGSTNISVTTAAINGSSQSISLSVSGLPSGVTGSFSPATVTAGGSSTLTLTASSSASGSSTYTVTGSSTTTHSANGSVTVSGGGGGCVTNQIQNSGFENGTSPWTATAGVLGNAGTAHTGTQFAWLDGYGTTHTDTLSQSVTSTCSVSQLCLWLRITTAETTTTTAFDTLKVQYKGTTLGTFSNLNAGAFSAYKQVCFAVSGTPSASAVNFVGAEDSSLQTSFFIDDVTLQ